MPLPRLPGRSRAPAGRMSLLGMPWRFIDTAGAAGAAPSEHGAGSPPPRGRDAALAAELGGLRARVVQRRVRMEARLAAAAAARDAASLDFGGAVGGGGENGRAYTPPAPQQHVGVHARKDRSAAAAVAGGAPRQGRSRSRSPLSETRADADGAGAGRHARNLVALASPSPQRGRAQKRRDGDDGPGATKVPIARGTYGAWFIPPEKWAAAAAAKEAAAAAATGSGGGSCSSGHTLEGHGGCAHRLSKFVSV